MQFRPGLPLNDIYFLVDVDAIVIFQVLEELFIVLELVLPLLRVELLLQFTKLLALLLNKV